MSLLIDFPEVAELWDYERNYPLTPDQVASFSHHKVWWLCKKNPSHHCFSTISSKAKHYGCRYCSNKYEIDPEESLAAKFPGLVKEWDISNKFNPAQVAPYSDKQVLWCCARGHKWTAPISRRTKQKSGCSFCRGKVANVENNLVLSFPEIAAEWDYNLNLRKPEEYLPYSGKKVWWRCKQHHTYEMCIKHRTLMKCNCPYCSGKLPTKENNLQLKFPDIAKEWHPTKNGSLKPSFFTGKSHKKVWWKCSRIPTHFWESVISNRTNNNTGCPVCAHTYTGLEQHVETLLGISKFGKCILTRSKYKPDFKLSDSIYMNVDGLYWHSFPQRQPRSYHLKLRQAFESEGLRLLQFYEDEIRDKWPIVENIINYSLGKITNKISARECEIIDVSVPEANQFYTENHLMGPIKFVKHFGLKYSGKLYAMMSVKQKGSVLIIERFSILCGSLIRGGFQKLLTYMIKKANPEKVVSFCDLRYATGKVYESAGFTHAGTSLGWCWTDKHYRFNRLKCRAEKDRSEKENAVLKNWVKLYDAGQAKYVLNLS